MALTYSNMMPLQAKAPDFELSDVVSGQLYSTEQLKGRHGLVVMFICNHCPYVIHVQQEIAQIAMEFTPQGFGFVGISSNDVDRYPTDAPQYLKAQALKVGFQFPYLFDERQKVAKDYQAACTPDFFLFDHDLACVYRGRMDGATPGNGVLVDGKDLRQAMNNLLGGVPIGKDQYPSMGCGIKWKS